MPRKWWVLVAVACGTFMATLDASIVNISLSTLTEELNTSLAKIKWIVVAYFFVITCLLLPMGRISDLYGRKSVFSLGFFIFTMGSAFCGLSPNIGLLVFSRILQAVGASMLMANGPALISEAFPIGQRGGALGTLAMVVSVGLITGPAVGGILIAELGWRSIFLINVPIGLIGIGLVYAFVRPKPTRPTDNKSFDWTGALLQSLFLISFILLFDPPSVPAVDHFGFPVVRAILVLITFGVGYYFVQIEARTPNPIFDLSLLKNRVFWSANLSAFLIFVAYSSIAILLPYYFERVLKFSTASAGYFMTVIPLIIFISAPISGRLSDRWGSRELCLIGAVVLAAGLFCFAGLFGLIARGGHYEARWIVLCLSLAGLGIGLFQSPNNNAIMASVPIAKLGVASALIATVRNLGLFAGAGFATSFYTWRASVSVDSTSAYQSTYAFAGIIALAAVLTSMGRKRGKQW